MPSSLTTFAFTLSVAVAVSARTGVSGNARAWWASSATLCFQSACLPLCDYAPDEAPCGRSGRSVEKGPNSLRKAAVTVS